MMSTIPNAELPVRRLDPLEFLPCSTVIEYNKREVIYGYDEPCDSIYVVLTGLVRVTAIANHGNQFLMDLYGKDELFGDLGLMHNSAHLQRAVAFPKVTLMRWRTDVIQEIIQNRPKLAIALLQTCGQRAMAMTVRLQHLCFEPIINRLAIALLHFSERTGVPLPDGNIQMEPLTHEILSQSVGTSREVVTCHMLQLRRLGLIQYSRKMIILNRDTIERWLQASSHTRHEHEHEHAAEFNEPVRTFTAAATAARD